VGAFATPSIPIVADDEPSDQLSNGGFVTYDHLGITINAPAAWEVENGSGDTVFDFNDDASGLKGMVAFTGDTFPGLIALPMFETLAEMLVQTMGPGAKLAGVERLETYQGLPALKIAFRDAENEDIAGDGVIFMIGTGDNAYGVIASSPAETWLMVEPIIAELAVSLMVDEELVTLETAVDGDLVVDDPAGSFAVTIPEGWHVTPTQDDELTLLIADPDVRVVGAVGGSSDLSANDEALQALIEATAGSIDEQMVGDLLGSVLDALNMGGDSTLFNPELTKVFPSVGDYLGVIRLGGALEVDDGVEMPLVTYLGVDLDSIGLLMVFGAPDETLGREETMLEILGSIEFTE
jgi:hypothetical protein